MKKLTMNVMLLVDGVKFDDPDSFIKKYKLENEIKFDKGDIDATLYHKEGNIDHPLWVKSFANKIGGVDLCEIIKKSQSHGVTLYIKVKNRVFAINWGASAKFNA